MIKKFGIKEAIASRKFAKTPEQKRTVLATMAMLGIKNCIAKQIKKGKVKANAKLATADLKAVKLHKKLRKQGRVTFDQQTEIKYLNTVNSDWEL
jgi:hypothetical protein